MQAVELLELVDAAMDEKAVVEETLQAVGTTAGRAARCLVKDAHTA